MSGMNGKLYLSYLVGGSHEVQITDDSRLFWVQTRDDVRVVTPSLDLGLRRSSDKAQTMLMTLGLLLAKPGLFRRIMIATAPPWPCFVAEHGRN